MHLRHVLIVLIRLYQRFVSPRKDFSCAYRCHTGRASCSTLGLRAVRRHGAWAGLGILRRRLARCGAVHRQHTAARRPALPRWPSAQRGMCDLGCDVPCDMNCDLPCDGLDACDLPCDTCSIDACDGWDWFRRERRERQARQA